MKTQSYAIPNALAVTTALIFVVCRILVGIFPDLSFAVAQSWFHGIEVSKQGTWDLSMPTFILGLISVTISAWIIGYIFVKIYSLLRR
ncbi:hypothetical protein HYT74_02140 [Candidatus Daviesbacteria bacterium]|nr:hypothetical protein [Candidatus Daviesbacteria bacterium]